MKKRFTILTAALALLAFLAFPMGMRGQTRDVETFTFSELGYGNAENVTTVEGDNVTLTFDAGSNASNSPKYYNTGSGVRMYAGNTLEVALNDQTGDTRITSIDFTFSGTSYTGGLENWTGSETSHTFTATGTARIQVIAVTFSEGGTAPTTYTVTYYANVTGTAPVVDTYVEGADVTLRAANTFTNEGYTFSEWNTDADGDGDAYEAGEVIEDIDDDIELYAIWTENPVSDDHWVLTDLANLTANDVFVIVGNNGSNYAMSNDNGTDPAPSAVAVTVTGNEITSTVAANIQWNISGNATNGYTFYPNGSTTTWLYCTNTNNGVRVGTNANKTFVVDHDYLKHTITSRYVGIYNSQDWRCYTSYTATNIANQTFAFYKKMTGALPPSISANDIDLEFDSTGATISYTINNSVEGGTISAAVTEGDDWLTLEDGGFENGISVSCEINSSNTPRTAIVTITYTYGDNQTVTKDVTVTQEAGPAQYTIIPELFEAATSTETYVYVTFGNWVVSGVSSNGKNVFVTDNNGNGFVIYYNTDMSNTFAAGNILSGTVLCKLKKYNGFAELLNVDATDLTITTGGTVTVADVAMANLAGVNTGALLHYDNLTCVLTTNTAGTTTYYNLTDGTTTIQVYNAIYAFGTLVEGKTYNITGIYQQYNNTKEILPRSAEDIEAVEVQHEEYTLTVSNLSHVNLFIFGGEDSETIISTEDGETTAQVYNGTEVLVSIDVEAGYVFQSLTITDGNGDAVEMEELEPNEYYSFVMPTSNVTITATAEVLTGDNYELYSGALVEGDYLIVYNGKAMNNTVSSNRLQYEEVTAYNDVITTDNAEIVWHIAPSGNYWTIFSADANAYAASTGTKNQATTMTDGTDEKALWTVSGNYDFVNKYNSDNNINSYLRNNGTYGFACYGTTTGGALSLYKKVEDTPITETYTLDITGYAAGSLGGYYLIASPVAVDPATVEGMTEGTFDLYYFDQAEEAEWRNYEANTFNLEPGKGYLYAKQATTEGEVFNFTLTGTPYNGAPIILNKAESGDFPGWNLVGNPFDQTVYIDRNYYTMNDEGTALILVTGRSIQPKEGFFVLANYDEEELPLTTEAPVSNDSKIIVNLSNDRSSVIDRAMIRFGESSMLPKFMLNQNDTKMYIPKDGNDYAVVRSNRSGSIPVNFEPAEDGTYTISINTENVTVNYLHLIDHETGLDIDLRRNPRYRFEAKTCDEPKRFELVFRTGSSLFKEVFSRDGSSENFGFCSDGEIIINGEGTLQVVDMTGRVVLSGDAMNRVSTSGMTPGVYVLRLINGSDTKVQKIVID